MSSRAALAGAMLVVLGACSNGPTDRHADAPGTVRTQVATHGGVPDGCIRPGTVKVDAALRPEDVWSHPLGHEDSASGNYLAPSRCGDHVRPATWSCRGTYPYLGTMGYPELTAWYGAQGVETVLRTAVAGSPGGHGNGNLPRQVVQETLLFFASDRAVADSDLMAAASACGKEHVQGRLTAYEVRVPSTHGQGQVPAWYLAADGVVVAVTFDGASWTGAERGRVVRAAITRMNEP